MEQEILEKIEEQSEKLKKISHSIEQMRKYFLITLVITVAMIVLPLIGLIIVIPQFINAITGAGLGL